MNKKRLSEKEVKLLLLLLSLVLLAGSYFLVYSRFNNMALAIEEENLLKGTKLSELENMEKNKDKVVLETEHMIAEKELIIAKMPKDVTQEKAIYIIDKMEKTVGVKIGSIGFSMNEVLQSAAESTTVAAPVEEPVEAISTEEPVAAEALGEQEEVMVGYCSKLSLQYTATYAQLKEMIRYIARYEDRMTLEKIGIGFDTETGNLFGSMEVAMYSVEGTKREYEPPVIEGIQVGVSNILRSKN